ncbi:DNA-processing protein DprA [Metamycoplasma sualvi]|uniref:DNA-processing protein DprA n=1 Tax=Metamycoplasma sualvi TaxID=2125 RepID=UPI00387301D2
MNLVLIYFAIKYKGYFHDIYNAIKKKEFIQMEELEKIGEDLSSGKIKAITIIDEDYPEPLKQINQPPFVLFYEGNKELLKEKLIMLTGDFSNENINKFINESAFELSKNYTLVSNFSKGLDEKIIDNLIKNNQNLILISSNGLTNPYFGKNINELKFNKDKYLIISEYPENVNLNHKRLIQRNRISIGLSEALIIASSYKESKISNLVSCALEQGKDIFCFPGLQSENDGNNLLIRDGAKMITSIKNKI